MGARRSLKHALSHTHTRARARILFFTPPRYLGCGWLGDRVVCATFDGDTDRADREHVRQNANIILTNPDTLHATILPNHADWRRVLVNAKVVVIDEAHS